MAKETTVFSVRLTPRELQLLRAAAERLGVSESDVARRAITDASRHILTQPQPAGVESQEVEP